MWTYICLNHGHNSVRYFHPKLILRIDHWYCAVIKNQFQQYTSQCRHNHSRTHQLHGIAPELELENVQVCVSTVGNHDMKSDSAASFISLFMLRWLLLAHHLYKPLYHPVALPSLHPASIPCTQLQANGRFTLLHLGIVSINPGKVMCRKWILTQVPIRLK